MKYLALIAALLLFAAPAHAQLYAAVLPSSRTVTAGQTATAFATIINAGTVTAMQCRIGLSTSTLPSTLSYQTTDPATNQPTGTPNTPVDIPAGGSQSFVIAFTTASFFPFAAIQARFDFGCAGGLGVLTIPGVNTFNLASTKEPAPDIIAIAATPSHDGIATVPGAFSVAAVNVGVAAPCAADGFVCACVGSGFEVSASGAASATVCRTDATTGQCVGATASKIDASIVPEATATFSVFASGNPTFDPAANRLNVTFRQYAEVMFHPGLGGLGCLTPLPHVRVYHGERGSTSVAVKTAP